MSDTTSKKRNTYKALAGAFLSGGLAQAQLAVTNANDTLIATDEGFYDVDINQDNIGDFRITQYINNGVSNNVNGVTITPLGNNGHQVAGELKSTFNYPFKLNIGDSIGPTQTQWNGAGGPFELGYLVYEVDGATYPNSNWVGPVSDGYLGLRLLEASNLYYYGWARLDIAADNKSFVVKEFAFEQTLDSVVYIGGHLLSDMEHFKENLHFYAYNNILMTKNPLDLKDVSAKVIDLAGRTLVHVAVPNGEGEIDLSHLATGVYTVLMQRKGLIRVEKINITH